MAEDRSESSQDVERIEERYSEKNEAFLISIKEQCLEVANEHDVQSHILRKKHNCFSIPCICLPIVAGALSSFIPPEYGFVNAFVLSVSGVTNGLLSFKNYSKKFQQHGEYASRYSELAAEISTEMCRGKKFRQPFDVFLLKVTTKFSNLNSGAPMI